MLQKFDFHVHSYYSLDGQGTPSSIIEAAMSRDLVALAITDHGPELSVGISPAKIIPRLQEIEIAREDAGIPVFIGMEANIISPGEIDLDDRLVEKLDLVLMGMHNLKSPVNNLEELAREYLTTVVNVVKRKQADILAHPFQFQRYLLPYLAQDEVDEFVKLAAENEVAVELNSKYRVPDEDFLKSCLREGVKLSVGTDAHTLAEVGRVDWPMATLRRIGAKQEDMVLDRFLG
jgi:putative hydrolase